jgi:hypothetical protein
VADAPKLSRAKPVAERFEVFELHPTAHLTDEQKQWPVVKLGPAERFEALLPQPTLTLKLYLDGSCTDAERIALAANIYGLIQALSDADRALGGGGLALADQRAEAATVVLTLRHAVAEGAADRAAQLVEMLNGAVTRATFESKADVSKLLDAAAQSPANRVKLFFAGTPTVSRCEVLLRAA